MSTNPLGTAIRAAREKQGLSLRQFAKLIGVAVSAASRFESGEYVPRDEILGRIADILELDLKALSRLTGKLRPEDVAYLKRRPLAAELLRRMTDGDVGDARIGRMLKLSKE